MAYRYILLEKEDHIATLTLNRPDRLNALGHDINTEIASGLKEVDDDQDVRVLIVTGAGRAFCAGGDFKNEHGAGTPASFAASKDLDPVWLSEHVYNYVMGISGGLMKLRVPTIAMVQGVAVGAGFSMAQACDIRIGSDQARFMVAWTRRGVVPAFGDTWMLPRIIGVGKAAELIFTGRMVEAQEALSMGILNKLVPHAQLREETLELAKQIASGPPLALRWSKVSMYQGLNTDFEAAVRLLATFQGPLHLTQDFRESTKAFQEKREPVFKGK
ncbi:MAG: enoyl-CoA hydratase/isomerase family protein [Chloroflexi bacterium]|nr:enoyl-CoA hydratase/isomerase family protein [Chloroflexota bacterium]